MARPPYAKLLPGGKDDTGVNWDEWHIPAKDQQGHYVKWQIKMPERLLGLMQEAITRDVYPYRSIGYLARHALYRHMVWLRSHPDFEDGVGSTIHVVNAVIEIVRDDEYMEDYRTVFDRLEERVRDHMARGNDSRAQTMVVKVWSQIKQMHDDFWRGEYEKELKKRFGHLLKGEGEEGETGNNT